jgi:hypothetical protein
MEQQETFILIISTCALSWHIKHAGNKVWSATNIRDFERQHATWLQKNVYCL